MAMIDYGTILCRNGVIMNAGEMFMDKTDRGCALPETLKCRKRTLKKTFYISDEYFAYAGDLDFMMCFYKLSALIIVENKVAGMIHFGEATYSVPAYDPRYGFVISTKAPYEKFFNLFQSGIMVTVENIDHDMQKDEFGHNYYTDKYHVCFYYKGDRYDIFTGYGIDNDVDVYNRIKFDHYGYTEKEREVLDRVFGIGSDEK